ncbi:MAG: nucleotidyltransferase domain-containing protein [Gaiellaceae bacterium]
MTTTLPRLARELQTTDRTLRRALEQGLLRAHRSSPRTVELPLSEQAYLRRNWSLLADLRQALRTEPGVSLAVLFGSRARGDSREDSDADLLVAFRLDDGGRRADRGRVRALSERLSLRLGLNVQIVSLSDVETAPLLFAEVLRDGRVLVDRDDLWFELVERRDRINRAAFRERRELDARFARFVADRCAA